MSGSTSRPTEHREELLAARALGGLDADEADELAGLLDGDDDASFDLAVAALDLAHVPANAEPLPEHLAARVADAARGYFAEASAPPVSPSAVIDRAPPLPAAALPARAGSTAAGSAPANDVVRWLGWAGAAAGFALAAWSYATRPEPVAQAPAQIPSAPASVAAAPRPKPPPLAEQRAALLGEAKDAVRVDWTQTKDAAAQGASGDVVWSDALQKGFMRFKGLAVNDPEKLQYQLWIFDPTQDKRYPVDGGVFDIDAAQADPATGEVIVPIIAKLRVKGPTLFAVTVEKPGGVVVSSRERIALVASPKG